MSDIGHRISQLRRDLGWSQAELAQRCGWDSQSRISGYERGDRAPRERDWEIIAEALGCNKAWLVLGIGDPHIAHGVREEQATYSHFRSAPVLALEDLPLRLQADSAYLTDDGRPMRPLPTSAPLGAVWVKITGDTMINPAGAPSLTPGAWALVEPCTHAKTGEIVAASVNGSPTIRMIVEDAGQTYLKALNPTYPVIPVEGQLDILGVIHHAEIAL